MTRFYYTPDLQQTVTNALGNEWEYENLGPESYWAYPVGPLDYWLVAYQRSDYDGNTIGAMVEVTNYLCLWDLKKLAALVSVIEDAEDRLRAAGLKEVDE